MKFEAMNGNLLPITEKTKPGINTTGIGDGGGGDNGDGDAANAHTEMKLLTEELEFRSNLTAGSKELLENKIEKSVVEQDVGSKTTNEEEQHEEELEEVTTVTDALDKDETTENGKKKGTRKKRSINWEEAERSLLLEVIKPKAEFVENRSIDAKSIKAKSLAWIHITKHFNALNFRNRSLDQIKVQWRSLKNLAKREHQQKPDKGNFVEGASLVEYLEELLKETNVLRTNNKTNVVNKKEPTDLDDEDTPLAALPAVTATQSSDENTTQTSNTNTMALPSPPLSAAESQHELLKETVGNTRKRKKPATQSRTNKQKQTEEQELTKIPTTTTIPEAINGATKTKRQRAQNIKKEAAIVDSTSNIRNQTTCIEQSALALALTAGTEKHSLHSPTDVGVAHSSHNALNDLTKTNLSNAQNNNNNNATSADVKYKKQLFELMKHARLTEMDYMRREYEQKLRFAQMEQEFKMNYSRQMEDLKMRLLREEHDLRMRQQQAEHEARMRIYATKATKNVN